MARQALWRVLFTVPDAAAAEAAARALDDRRSKRERVRARRDGWRVEGLSADGARRAAIEARLALAWLGAA